MEGKDMTACIPLIIDLQKGVHRKVTTSLARLPLRLFVFALTNCMGTRVWVWELERGYLIDDCNWSIHDFYNRLSQI